MYRIFLLDIDNTLLDFDAAEKRGFRKIIESYGLEFNSDMLSRYQVINRGLWVRLEQGTISRDEVLYTRFHEFFRLYGKEADGVETEHRYRSYLNESADLLPNAKETLMKLKEMGKKLYSASNGVYNTQILRLKKAEILPFFDGMFISEKIGYEKPSPSFFDYCFKNIPDFKKEETLMVGDSLSSDIQGAVNAGIDSCLIHPGQEPAASAATYTIRDMSGLLNLPSKARN